MALSQRLHLYVKALIFTSVLAIKLCLERLPCHMSCTSMTPLRNDDGVKYGTAHRDVGWMEDGGGKGVGGGRTIGLEGEVRAGTT